jgi:hypothetical protein
MEPFGNGPLWRPLQLSAVSQSPLSSPTIRGMAAAGTVGADIRAAAAGTEVGRRTWPVGVVMEVVADTQAVLVDTEVGHRTWPAGVVMEVVADTQVGVVMEAAPRTWLAVETGAAADMEAARTLTPDKRTRAKGIPEVAIASPMPTAARIRIKQLDTRITRFPQIQEKASRNKTGQTARLNTGR